MEMRIGAHVSTSGSLHDSVHRAVAIGAECAQIFVGAPQRWAVAHYSDEDVTEYLRLANAYGIGPNVVHSLYLVNLASPDPEQRERSVMALIDQMDWCERLGVLGLVVHVGSGKGVVPHDEALAFVVEGIEQMLSQTRDSCFLIENTAGMGSSIGSDFRDIGTIISRLGFDQRIRVCLDTAHTFEAGHDISTKDGLDAVIEEFDQYIGLDRLTAIHANDSKSPFGSKLDRHQNIGAGYLGEDAFGWFMTHPAVQELPFFLEVPGVAGRGPDRENVDTLRRLAGRQPSTIGLGSSSMVDGGDETADSRR
ncbi:MAG: deoxyribonuclease [Chloroflexi bacterium]|nr:deoxyribonuclease [Chloroflexota bacterium]